MSPTEEIAIKIGVKSGDLKAALADAGASIKRLKKDGEDSSKGFLKSFNEMKRGFRDIKEVIMGAGIVEGFLKLNEAAVKFAENWKGGYDADVAATLRLKDAQQDLGSIVTNFVGRAGVTLVGLMEKAGVAIGALVYGTDAAAEALNKMDAESRKAFDEAKAKKLHEAEEKLAKFRHDAAIEAATDAEKINVIAADYVKLLQELSKEKKGTVEYANKELEVEQAAAALRKQDSAVRKQEWEDRQKAADAFYEQEKQDREEREKATDELAKLNEKQAEMNREELTAGQQQNALLKERTALEKELANYEVGTVEYNEVYAKLLENRQALKKNEGEISKNNVEIAKILLIPEAQRTDLQKEQLRLLTGETTEHKQQLELSQLLNKGVDNLTESERKRLQVLVGQTSEMNAQADAAERQARALNELYAKSITQKGDVRNLSDVQLDQLVQNLNKNLASVKQQDSQYFGIGQPIGSYKSIEQYLLQQNLDQAIAEQKLRSQFAQRAPLGDDYLQRNYAPDVYSRLSQLINPDQQKKDSQNLGVIASGLQSLFPKNFDGALK